MEAQAALLNLPRALAVALQDPHRDDAAVARELAEDLAAWKKAVTAARDWCARYAEALKKGKEDKDGIGVRAFREALQDPNSALPQWLARRVQRSLELTARLYPTLVRRHTQESLTELQRRFTAALEREAQLEAALARGEAPPDQMKADKQKKDAGKDAAPAAPVTRTRATLIALKSLAQELVPSPLALFETVAAAADNSAPTPSS